MRLDPYLVVLAPAEGACDAAVVLRSGGYQVKKLTDVTTLADDVARLEPDGVVLDVNPLQATRALRDLTAIVPHVPLMVITSLARFPSARTISRINLSADLISAVDRMLVDSLSVAV